MGKFAFVDSNNYCVAEIDKEGGNPPQIVPCGGASAFQGPSGDSAPVANFPRACPLIRPGKQLSR